MYLVVSVCVVCVNIMLFIKLYTTSFCFIVNIDIELILSHLPSSPSPSLPYPTDRGGAMYQDPKDIQHITTLDGETYAVADNNPKPVDHQRQISIQDFWARGNGQSDREG